MNILIKGMEMPKVCAVCPFWETRYDPGYYNYEHCKALGKIFNEHSMEIDVFEEKFNDCPLVEIVTCGECKHRTYCYSEVHITNKRQTIDTHKDIGYCSYGERRADETTI